MKDVMLQCLDCIYFRNDCTCTAFPAGIPTEIIANQFDHRYSYPGDQGIRFKKKTTQFLWNFDPEKHQLTEKNGYYFVVRVLNRRVSLLLFEKQGFTTRIVQTIENIPQDLLFFYNGNQPGTYKINYEIRTWLENQYLR